MMASQIAPVDLDRALRAAMTVALGLLISACGLGSAEKTREQSPVQMVRAQASSLDRQTSCQTDPDCSVSRLDQSKGKYPPVNVGAPLPFVCSKPFPAAGKLAGRPNLQIMWENYIHDRPGGVWLEIGGQVETNGCLPYEKGGWRNACTVRLSHMLNAAGMTIPRMAGKTVTGANGQNYIFRLSDAREFLLQRWGAPDLDIKDGTAWSDDLPDRPGLVLMSFPPSDDATGHATIWNGAGAVDGSAIGGLRVMFWALPCTLPEGRTSDARTPNANRQ